MNIPLDCGESSEGRRQFKGWRVYGNQHGTWVKMPHVDYREMCRLARIKGVTAEGLLAEAIREHCERVLST